MKYCIKCGTQLKDDAMFCLHCGNKIGENSIAIQNERNRRISSFKYSKFKFDSASGYAQEPHYNCILVFLFVSLILFALPFLSMAGSESKMLIDLYKEIFPFLSENLLPQLVLITWITSLMKVIYLVTLIVITFRKKSNYEHYSIATGVVTLLFGSIGSGIFMLMGHK